MKWKIRPGFALFHSPDEALEYQCGNRAVKPRAKAGDVVTLTGAELGTLWRHKSLGMLEPVDDESRKYFGDTVPLVSRAENPSPSNFAH
jgi:hypothetical protein